MAILLNLVKSISKTTDGPFFPISTMPIYARRIDYNHEQTFTFENHHKTMTFAVKCDRQTRKYQTLESCYT